MTSKKEESPNPIARISPRSLQKKLNAISKERSQTEGVQEEKKSRDNLEVVHKVKGSRTERSVSIDYANNVEKNIEIFRQLKVFYTQFKYYALNEESIQEDLIGVIREDKEDDPLEMLKCMNYIIELLISTAQSEKVKSTTSYGSYEKPANDYEELLQKAENDIRQHIRIEQQMKLLIDSLQARVDEFDKDGSNSSNSSSDRIIKENKEDQSKLLEALRQRDEEVSELQKALKAKEESIKSLEAKAISIAILEHTIKSLKESHKKDKENIRNYYEQELANITKEIQHFQRILSISLSNEDKVKILQEELVSAKDFNIKKIQLLENRLRQLDDGLGGISERENTEPTLLYTDPGFDERRYSAHPLATTASIMKTRGYDLKSHRCSTENFQKNSDSSRIQPIKQTSVKKKRDIINELKSTSILGARLVKASLKGEQPQQLPAKTQRETGSYFNYLDRKFENLTQGNDKKEPLRTFEQRRSSSVKRGIYMGTSMGFTKEKSYDRLGRGDISKTHDERSESFSPERNSKPVPKLVKATTIPLQTKVLKH